MAHFQCLHRSRKHLKDLSSTTKILALNLTESALDNSVPTNIREGK